MRIEFVLDIKQAVHALCNVCVATKLTIVRIFALKTRNHYYCITNEKCMVEYCEISHLHIYCNARYSLLMSANFQYYQWSRSYEVNL